MSDHPEWHKFSENHGGKFPVASRDGKRCAAIAFDELPAGWGEVQKPAWFSDYNVILGVPDGRTMLGMHILSDFRYLPQMVGYKNGEKVWRRIL
jgi:hypothetical protein